MDIYTINGKRALLSCYHHRHFAIDGVFLQRRHREYTHVMGIPCKKTYNLRQTRTLLPACLICA